MKILLALLLGGWVWPMSTFAKEKPMVIYLVRHAEKITQDPKNNDPLLTLTGLQRAEALAKKLKKVRLSAIYSTNFQRTKLTALPTAQKKKMEILPYNPKHLSDWATEVLGTYKAKSILVVGHSNTILETIEALGGQRPLASITDQEYDFFFKVTIHGNQKPLVELTHYGSQNSNAEGEQQMNTPNR